MCYARTEYGYLGAGLAIVGCSLGAAFGALRGGTIVSVVLSLPIAVYGLIVSVIIIGAIDSTGGYHEGMCPKVGYAYFSSGFAVGGAGLAGGLAIGMTGVLYADFVECATCACCRSSPRYAVAIFACIAGNLIAFCGMIVALIMSGARCYY